MGFLGGSDGKESACKWRTPGFDPCGKISPGEGNSYLILPGEFHGERKYEGIVSWGQLKICPVSGRTLSYPFPLFKELFKWGWDIEIETPCLGHIATIWLNPIEILMGRQSLEYVDKECLLSIH